jgi:hypothetical protein
MRSPNGALAECVVHHERPMIVHAHIFLWCNIVFIIAAAAGRVKVVTLFAVLLVLLAANTSGYYLRYRGRRLLTSATADSLRRWVFVLPILFLISSFVLLFQGTIFEVPTLESAAMLLVPSLVITLTFGVLARCCRAPMELPDKVFWIYICVLLPLFGAIAWLVKGEKLPGANDA